MHAIKLTLNVIKVMMDIVDFLKDTVLKKEFFTGGFNGFN